MLKGGSDMRNWLMKIAQVTVFTLLFCLQAIIVLSQNKPANSHVNREIHGAKPERPHQPEGFYMNALFKDNMILQQNSEAPIFGRAPKGTKISIKTSWGESAETVAGNDNRWLTLVKTPSAVKGEAPQYTIDVNWNSGSVTIKNVLIGDVWLCVGQSNMGWQLAFTQNAEETLREANLPNLRLIRLDRQFNYYPLDTIATRENWGWHSSSEDKTGRFSAISAYFGLTLQKHLDIPVGLIGAAYAGSHIQAWMPREIQENDVEFAAQLDRFKPDKQFYPGNIYNAMIHPLFPYGIKGMIYYQGEANSDHLRESDLYEETLTRFIEYYREQWHSHTNGTVSETFPFYMVQLPSWLPVQNRPAEIEQSWPRTRESMRQVSLKVSNAHMAVSIDTGDPVLLHPKDKQPVGKRLGYLALANTYKLDIVGEGPVLKSYKTEGNKIILTFDLKGSEELMSGKDGDLDAFAIAGADSVFYWGNAVINGNTVEVSSPDVELPIAVRYAWAANPSERNLLYNSNGFPASPFRTDDWEFYKEEGYSTKTVWKKPLKPDGYVQAKRILPEMKLNVKPAKN